MMGIEGRGPVTVEQIVASRDRRKLVRRRMFADHNLPIVCVTLVSPGPVKWWSWTDAVFGVAEAELRRAFGLRGWMVREWSNASFNTGPEAQIAVNANPWEIKRLLLKMEETHLLGRLWDLDVITPEAVLDRATIGIRPRRCLVCTADADTCTQTDVHPDEALLKAVERILQRAASVSPVAL